MGFWILARFIIPSELVSQLCFGACCGKFSEWFAIYHAALFQLLCIQFLIGKG